MFKVEKYAFITTSCSSFLALHISVSTGFSSNGFAMVSNERMFEQETAQCVSAAHFPPSLCVATVVTALNGRSPGHISSTLRTRGRHETAGSEDGSQHLSSVVQSRMLPVLLRFFF